MTNFIATTHFQAHTPLATKIMPCRYGYWASPLTPPPPTTTQLPTAGNQLTSDNVVHNQRNNSNNRSISYNQQEYAEEEEEEDEAQQQPALQLYAEDAEEGGDVVDGGNWSAPQKTHQHEPQRQHHFYYNNHHYGGAQYNNQHHHHQQQHHHHHQHHYNHLEHHDNNYHHYQQKEQQQQQQQQQQKHYTEQQQKRAAHDKQKKTLPTHSGKQPAMEATYNNNLFYYEPPVAAGITPTGSPTSGSCFGSATTDVDIAAVNELAQRVQTELRDAKKRHLDCTEVSLPYDLMPRIAAEIIKASEREPCGVRGCSLYIDFECEPSNVRRIASFKVDDCTVSTFELYLTLKQDKSGWTSLLPQFIKNLTRSNTILISPDFTLTKNKLYSCD